MVTVRQYANDDNDFILTAQSKSSTENMYNYMFKYIRRKKDFQKLKR